MKRAAKDAASKTAFALADKGRGQRAEDHYEAVRGGKPFVDDVILTEGDAVRRTFGKLPIQIYS